MSQINWAIELRKIEREYDGLPPVRSRTQIRLQKIQEIVAREKVAERLSLIGIWVRVALVGTLAIALWTWPYGRDCGFPLAAFFVSEIMVIVGAAAIVLRTWRDRLVAPFACSAVCILMAWTMLTAHALPRVGYSTVPGANAGWICRDAPSRDANEP